MTDHMTPEDRALCDKLRERVFYGDARLANMKKHDPLGMAALHRIEALSAANAALNDELANLGRENRRLREAVSEVGALREIIRRGVDLVTHCEVSEGVCCCGDNMENHPEPMSCGHVATDHGAYVASNWLDDARAALNKLKGSPSE